MKKFLLCISLMLTALISHAQNTVKGDMNNDGILTITDVMMLINSILGGDEVSFPQYFCCPDNNHPHMIDLGLPSGTKWACCNVGTNKPDGYGSYYAWGETMDKDYYGWTNYVFCNGSQETCFNIENICGTQLDVATVKWGAPWQMPSYDQMLELKKECTVKYSSINDINGSIYVGPNGNSIFLPFTGLCVYENLANQNGGCYYWIGTQHQDNTSYAYAWEDNRGIQLNLTFRFRFQGLAVRPVAQ